MLLWSLNFSKAAIRRKSPRPSVAIADGQSTGSVAVAEPGGRSAANFGHRDMQFGHRSESSLLSCSHNVFTMSCRLLYAPFPPRSPCIYYHIEYWDHSQPLS